MKVLCIARYNLYDKEPYQIGLGVYLCPFSGVLYRFFSTVFLSSFVFWHFVLKNKLFSKYFEIKFTSEMNATSDNRSVFSMGLLFAALHVFLVLYTLYTQYGLQMCVFKIIHFYGFILTM